MGERRASKWLWFVLALIGGGTVVYWIIRGVLTLLMRASSVNVY